MPGSRGTILDRTGQRARGLRGRGDDLRDAVPGQGPAERPRTSSRTVARRRPRTRSSKALADRESGLRLHRPQGRPRRRASGSRSSSSPGSGCSPTAAASIRRASSPAQVIGAVGDRQPGPDRARGRPRTSCCTATDGERAGRPATRSASELERDTVAAATAGADLQLTLDAEHPGRDRAGARRGRRDLQPRRARPRSSWTRAPRRSSRWPTGRAVDPTDLADADARAARATWPPASPTSRARPSRRSPSPARSRRDWSRPRRTFDAAADDPGRRPHDRGVARRAATATPHASPTSSPSPRTSARSTIGLELGAERLRPAGSAGSASARPTGVDFPGEEQGIVPDARRVLGLDDGQPADRPGPLGDADADGGRLRGDRQRRHPAHAAADRSRTAASRRRADAGTRVISSTDAARAARRCSRACSAPGGTAVGGQRPRLHARRQDRHRAEGRRDGTYSETKFVASFVGFAPAQDPRLLVAVIVDEPAGRQLRRHGRGARVRRDRRSSRCRTCGIPPRVAARRRLRPRRS